MATTNFIQALTLLGIKFWYVWLFGFILFGAGFYYFYLYYINMRKFAPESVIEMKCSKPLIKKIHGRIIDASLNEIPIVVSPSKDNPSLIDDEHAFVSPNLVSSSRMGRKSNGTGTINYMVTGTIPFDFRSAAALEQLMIHIREKHPALDWMTESFEVMACVFSPTTDLPYNCKQAIVDNIRYGNIDESSEVMINDKTKILYDEILEIRKEMNITRIKPGVVNLGAALELSNIGISNAMVQEILVQQRRVDALGIIDDFFAKNVKYLSLIAMSGAAVLIFLLVLKYVA